MWTAVIVGVAQTSSPDTAMMDVVFSTEDGQTFTASYHLHAGNFKAPQDIEDFLREKVRNLESFDALRAIIEMVRDKVGVISSGVKAVGDKDLKDAMTLADAAVEIAKDVKP